jgi:hypothetical protein
MRVYALVAISAGMLSGSAPTTCTTPLRLPCMVVQSVNEKWSVLNRGVNYRHSRSYQQIASASDGSVAWETKFEEVPLIGESKVFAPTAALYLRPSDSVVHVMHADRKFSKRDPIIWQDRPYKRSKANDATCASGILHSGTDFQQTGEHTILGIKTFRWYRPLEYGGYEEQFLAPSLDCVPLRGQYVHRNMLRIPVLTNRTEVISIKFGEPDRTLFDIPAGYKEVPDTSAERVRRFVKANKRPVSLPASP